MAVVVVLALGGIYRVAHRQLQPSAFLEFRELSFGVGCGCVLTLAAGSFFHATLGTIEPIATQLVTAVIVVVAPLSGYFLAGRATRPLDTILRTTARLRPDRLVERLPLRGSGDELDRLDYA